jgi:hypothetical protein
LLSSNSSLCRYYRVNEIGADGIEVIEYGLEEIDIHRRAVRFEYHYLEAESCLTIDKLNPHKKTNNLNFPKHHTQAPKIHGKTSKRPKKAKQTIFTRSISKVSISMTDRSK